MTDRGRLVVLLHGVGVDASSFDRVAQALLRHGMPAVAVRRPAPAPMPEQAAVVVERLDRLEAGPVVLAGVSGGATLALATAMAAPDRVVAVVAHEPLVGPSAAALHSRVTGGYAALRAGAMSAAAWFRAMVGERSWSALAADGGGSVVDVDVDDVAPFATWAPTAGDLVGLRSTSVVTTVGGASPADRHAAAGVLAELAGARVVVLPDAGHLPQLECPAELAEVVVGSVAPVVAR